MFALKKVIPHTIYFYSAFSLLFHVAIFPIDDTSVNPIDITYGEAIHTMPNPKAWTIIIYMSADNDLRSFAARNIKQMALVGSNEFINILVQLDIRITGNKKITRRYYIEKNKILHVNSHDPYSQKMDSGDPETLISCCTWAIKHYPAQHIGLIFWNHGTGPLDPTTGRIINPTELFTFNPSINKFELDRNMGFIDYLSVVNNSERGICWDDSTGNYLTNQKLDAALAHIKTTCLHGKKFALIGFDACLMSSIEIANIIKNYADYMVGSQEVELGTGWNYQRVFTPFQSTPLSPAAFAQHIVNVYGITYSTITNDYTQSAINLNSIHELENNVDKVAQLLIECLQKQKNNSVKNMLQAARHKDQCTCFDEPSYLDLYHLYSSLQANMGLCTFTDSASGNSLKQTLHNALDEGKNIIKSVVFANTVGKNLQLAQGISIYFPERRIHYSYKKTPFAATNKWFSFLTQLLGA